MKRMLRMAVVVLFALAAGAFPFSARAKNQACANDYQKAAASYHELQKSRPLPLSQCRKLMTAFEQIAEKYPDCPKADESLYMAGQLGLMAYQAKGSRADLTRGLKAYRALIDRYPQSPYRDDAYFYSGEIYLLQGQKGKALESYRSAAASPRGDMKQKAQQRVAELTTKKPDDPAPAKTAAKTPGPAPKWEPLPSASSVAPTSKEVKTSAPDPALPPTPDPGTRSWTESVPAADPALSAHLQSIRSWSNREYTRVVMELDQEVPYEPPRLLKPDPALGTPPRLYIDFNGTALASTFRDSFPQEGTCFILPIGDGLLKKARAGQFAPAVVRVVLDIERLDHFRAFPLPGSPFRYVIDVYATPLAKAPPPTPGASPAFPSPPVLIPGDQATPAFTGRKYLIVLDAGHGGKDPGAIGPGGTREKDITLALVLRAKKALEAARPDVQVALIRSDDTFIGLVDRTAIANTMNADLFISIHCNASTNHSSRGVETYYLDNTTDHAALRLAAKENFVSEAAMEDSGDSTNKILADLITSSKVEDSVPLAHSIQNSIIRTLRAGYPEILDHGVKKAPFWVLTGATMPCVLIETSFISHPQEELRLQNSEYQDALALAIASGVGAYLDSYPLNPAGE